jgi:hypothetical protein
MSIGPRKSYGIVGKLAQSLNWKNLRKLLGYADVERLIISKVDQRVVRYDGVH